MRGVGETSDIVGKEMYTLRRPKGTPTQPASRGNRAGGAQLRGRRSGLRAVAQRLYYIGPYFRYERPQKGRYRQFHQIGAEILGDAGPLSDAELIAMLMDFLGALGHTELEVLINTVGDTESRQRYRDALAESLAGRSEELTADSQRRLETNPLRILDSKSAQDQKVLEGAPVLDDYLSDASKEHFDAVLEALDHRGIRTTRSPRLVRGLDYYTRTVFEIVSSGLGAQDAIVGGGRYDGLIAELGGPELPAIGFAIGEDRLIARCPPLSSTRSYPRLRSWSSRSETTRRWRPSTWPRNYGTAGWRWCWRTPAVASENHCAMRTGSAVGRSFCWARTKSRRER